MKAFVFLFVVVFFSCNPAAEKNVPIAAVDTVVIKEPVTTTHLSESSLIILGTIQDAGSPQIGCSKDCCKDLFIHPDKDRMVVSLGVADPENKKLFLFEATPDIKQQTKSLKNYQDSREGEMPDGIFLTHAHIGHYTGLMYLGKESIFAKQVPVYCMPRMKFFLEINGPWNQLIHYKNIVLKEINNKETAKLTTNIQVTPFLVPHRDEYAETVGYKITGPNKKALFIPDIDKWSKWKTSIIEEIAKVDYAFVDGTFYDAVEINNRDIREIPHPFITESMELFKSLPASEKKKIYFIHFNHTNPVLNKKSKAFETVINNGFNIAETKQVFPL